MYRKFQKSTNNKSVKCSFLASFSIMVLLFTFIPNTAYGASTTTDKIVGTKLSEPTALAVDSSGDNIYVVDTDGVEKIDISTNTTTSAAVDCGNPYGVALDNSGNIYVSDVESNMIYKTDKDVTTPLVTANAGLISPMGIALDSSNKIYVADYNNHNIRKFCPNGSYISSFNCNGKAKPYGVATDSNGNIYVAYITNDERYHIGKFSSDGNFSATIGEDIFSNSSRMQIAVDSSNNVYISNRNKENNKNIIYKMNSSGIIEVCASYSSSDHINGITVDKDGNIYVTEGHYVKKVTVSSELQIDTANPPNATVGTAYSYQFTSTGGIGEKTYTVTTPIDLPAGLTLSENGTLLGTPTAAGTSEFTIKATDSEGSTSSTSVKLIVQNLYTPTPPAPVIATPTSGGSSSGSSSDSTSTSGSDLSQITATGTGGKLVTPLEVNITSGTDGTKKGEIKLQTADFLQLQNDAIEQGDQSVKIVISDSKIKLSSVTVTIPASTNDVIVEGHKGLKIETQNHGVFMTWKAIQNFQDHMDGKDLYVQFDQETDKNRQAEINAAVMRIPSLSNKNVEAIGDSMVVKSNMPSGESREVMLLVGRVTSPAQEEEMRKSSAAYAILAEHSPEDVEVLQMGDISFSNMRGIITGTTSRFSRFTIIRLSKKTTDVGSWQNDAQGWRYIKNGEPVIGWNQIGGSWYLMNSAGVMQTGWQELNGEWYYLYNDGAMASNTMIDGCELGENGKWLYNQQL